MNVGNGRDRVMYILFKVVEGVDGFHIINSELIKKPHLNQQAIYGDGQRESGSGIRLGRE